MGLMEYATNLAGAAAQKGGGMGCSQFSLGDRVRIHSGNFQGIEGTVIVPRDAAYAEGTVLLHVESDLLPVTIWTSLDGHDVALRVPPELLERINAAED